MTRFESLSGLREPALVLDLLDALGLTAVPSLGAAVAALHSGDPAAALAGMLSLDPGAARDAADAAGEALAQVGEPPAQHALALDLVRRVAVGHAGDPALVATLLLEPFALEPGQTLWCPAGCPHAHVSGLGVEVQPSSDTTLRAGLTGKRVDVALFLAHLGDRGPLVLAGEGVGDEDVVTSPGGELRLGLTGRSGGTIDVLDVPSLLLCLEGPVDVTTSDASLRLGGGDGALVAAGAGPLRVASGGVVARASTLT